MDEQLIGTGGQSGLSLLEVMVSVAVLAVLAVGAGLATGGAVPGTERDATRFQRAFEQNWALAVMGRETRGLSITPQGLALARQAAGGWDSASRLYDWRGTVSLAHAGPGPLPGIPDIVLRPDGRSGGFALVFSGRGPAWRCVSDGWSALSCGPE
jgi:prepilin-type N-terminal cleavage/methylation domain-containing protein